MKSQFLVKALALSVVLACFSFLSFAADHYTAPVLLQACKNQPDPDHPGKCKCPKGDSGTSGVKSTGGTIDLLRGSSNL